MIRYLQSDKIKKFGCYQRLLFISCPVEGFYIRPKKIRMDDKYLKGSTNKPKSTKIIPRKFLRLNSKSWFTFFCDKIVFPKSKRARIDMKIWKLKRKNECYFEI